MWAVDGFRAPQPGQITKGLSPSRWKSYCRREGHVYCGIARLAIPSASDESCDGEFATGDSLTPTTVRCLEFAHRPTYCAAAAQREGGHRAGCPAGLDLGCRY